MLVRPFNAKERALDRWLFAMRTIRPLALLLIALAWIASAPQHLPLLVAMAAGDVLLDDSGNVKLDTSGNVMLDDGADNICSCGCPCTCPPDVSHKQSMIVSVSVTPCCSPDGLGNSYKLTDSSLTFCVQNRACGQWEGGAGTFHYNLYTSSDCTTGLVENFTSANTFARVLKQGSTWSLLVVTLSDPPKPPLIYVPCCSGTSDGGSACTDGTVAFSSCGAACGVNTVSGCISPSAFGHVMATTGSFSFTFFDTGDCT